MEAPTAQLPPIPAGSPFEPAVEPAVESAVEQPARVPRPARSPKEPRPARVPRPAKAPKPAARTTVNRSGPATDRAYIHEEDVVYRRPGDGEGSTAAPRRLGLRLLLAVLLVLAAVLVYALLVMPHRSGSGSGSASGSGGRPGRTAPAGPSATGGGGNGASSAAPTKAPGTKAGTTPPATKAPATTPAGGGAPLAAGYTLRHDTAGFTVAVRAGWARTGRNSKDEVRFTGDGVEMTVVPGRDASSHYGTDPVAYQLDEPELADFRASSWSSASGLTSLTVDGHPAAKGEYTYRDGNGQSVYACNLAVLADGKYHVVLVAGPDTQRLAVQQAFDQAVQTYRVG
jgi:hypothetical protein